jgi:hypothetical protein
MLPKIVRSVGDLPVAPAVTAAEIRNHLTRYDFARPVALDGSLEDVVGLLRRWSQGPMLCR